ncbi:MAG: hypothetical protein U0Y10_13190 [Spirosomataceae bacterium]
MRVFLKYLLIAFVIASYFQSALELTNDCVENTWHDEYDTYLHTESTTTIAVKAELQLDWAILPEVTFAPIHFPVSASCFATLPIGTIRIQEHKIFLKNCALLI